MNTFFFSDLAPSLSLQQEQSPKSPAGDFKISDLRPGSSSKGKSDVIGSSSQQHKGGRAGPRRMDDDISLELADKIAAGQLMLYEDIDLLLSQVSNLTDQALHLRTQADGGPQSCEPESKAPTTRNEEDELKLSCAVKRLEITNNTDLASLDCRNIELVRKASYLDSQVKTLQSLVNNLRSKLRSSNSHGDRTVNSLSLCMHIYHYLCPSLPPCSLSLSDTHIAACKFNGYLQSNQICLWVANEYL